MTFSDKLYNSNEKKGISQLIKDINNDFNKTNIDFNHNYIHLRDNDYFN